MSRFNRASGVAVVCPTDRPISVRNRCVIERFGGVFVLSRCFEFFCKGRGFCHTISNTLELEIKDYTRSIIYASYLDMLLSIWRHGQLQTSIYDKRDYFNFHITNVPFLISYIPSLPVYCVYLSALTIRPGLLFIWMFSLRGRRLSCKLFKQEYTLERFKSSFIQFYVFVFVIFMFDTGILVSKMKSPSH